METFLINNHTHPLDHPIQAEVCESFFRKLRGLMFQSSLAVDGGLLLVESRDSRLDTSIHMLFVGMDLGIVWINSSMQVVDTILARAWRPAYVPRQPARYVLEIHPSRLAEFNISDQVSFNEV